MELQKAINISRNELNKLNIFLKQYEFVSFDCQNLVLSDRDECASNPCQNSGTCVDKFAGYQCTCSSGVTGKNCEIGKGYSSFGMTIFLIS